MVEHFAREDATTHQLLSFYHGGTGIVAAHVFIVQGEVRLEVRPVGQIENHPNTRAVTFALRTTHASETSFGPQRGTETFPQGDRYVFG